MARPFPTIPHTEVGLLDSIGRAAREWRAFFSGLLLRVPLTGTVTFAAATTAAVTFAAPEMDASYNIHVEPPEDRRWWITSKTVTGFTINVSSSSSAIYCWTMHRR